MRLQVVQPVSVVSRRRTELTGGRGGGVSLLEFDVSELGGVAGVDFEGALGVVTSGVSVWVAVEVEVLVAAINGGVDVLVAARGIYEGDSAGSASAL